MTMDPEAGRAAAEYAAAEFAAARVAGWGVLSDAELWDLLADAGTGPDEMLEADVPGEVLVAELGAEAAEERRVPPGLEFVFPAGILPRDGDAPRPVGDGLFPGFAAGGVLDTLEPGPVLAGFAADAREAGLPRLSEDELIGLLRAWRRLASWAVAGELAAVGELAERRFAQADAAGEGPDVASASVEAELGCALTLTARGAQVLVERAGELSRLPATAAALSAGAIDEYRARVIAGELSGLDDAATRQVEARLIEKAPRQTSGQLRAAAHRAVMAVDPQAAVRRRERAQRDARVEVWSEAAGTAAIAGRDLPPAEVLAADKRIDVLARRLKQQGDGASMDQLRARVYLSLLSGIPVHELTADTADQADTSQAESAPSQAQGGDTPQERTWSGGRLAGRINLTMPFATLLGLSSEPGEVPGFGPVDAPTARSLADAAASSPGMRWCVSVTGADGQVIGHGCAPGHDMLAGGPMLIKVEPLAGRECRHERETASYVPSPSLRHLVEARDVTCTFPGCRRPAWQCDLDHTLAYDRGGKTCECNLAPLCRFHHQVKQAHGWVLEQPEPGVMRWVTPSGRTYMVTAASRSGRPP